MCGRYTLRAPASELAEVFGLFDLPELEPRYNIAPTQVVPVVRWDADRGQRVLVKLKWGLIPSWSKDPKMGYSMTNARAETVAEKPSFRQAFVRRRCLIVADGFYEWRQEPLPKQPFFIHRPDDRPMAFAGLWERWQRNGLDIESCTIIVTEANATMEPIHDRMPVILPPESWGIWLDPDFEDRRSLQSLLVPDPTEQLELLPVSTVVNNARNETPECVKPIGLHDNLPE